jgi:hypothetical protein
MRAALRGERERAERTRRRSTQNVLAPTLAAEPARVSEPEQAPARRSFLGRLLGK